MHRPTRPIRTVRVVALALLGVLLIAACSDDGGGSSSSTSAAAREVDVEAVLGELAEHVVVPAYADLGEDLDALAAATTALCAAPSDAALAAAREAWTAAASSWQRSRAVAVGPALEQRLMSDVGFAARARVITLLLEGTDPVDVAAISEEGAAGRGLYAAEELLFGEGSDALAGGDPRRCEYAASVATLAAQAAQPVVEAWTTGDATERFTAGLDGGPQSTVALVVNELSHRLEELDAMQLRDMAAADGPDDLDASRLGGPSDQRLDERRALLSGIADVIGDGGSGISAVVAAKDAGTADRTVEDTQAAVDALGELPPSVTAAFDDPDAVAAAADAVARLKVLMSTELASKLGVTITFSDSDGDS